MSSQSASEEFVQQVKAAMLSSRLNQRYGSFGVSRSKSGPVSYSGSIQGSLAEKIPYSTALQHLRGFDSNSGSLSPFSKSNIDKMREIFEKGTLEALSGVAFYDTMRDIGSEMDWDLLTMVENTQLLEYAYTVINAWTWGGLGVSMAVGGVVGGFAGAAAVGVGAGPGALGGSLLGGAGYLLTDILNGLSDRDDDGSENSGSGGDTGDGGNIMVHPCLEQPELCAPRVADMDIMRYRQLQSATNILNLLESWNMVLGTNW